MFRQDASRKKDYLSPSVGWLFTDLLLALSVLFMISYVLPPSAVPPVTPTRPPDALVLDRNAVQLNIRVDDPDALSHGNSTAKSKLAGQIRQQITSKRLQKRRAGIVVAYGGAPTSSEADLSRAFAIDRSVYAVLQSLGKQKFVFCNSVVYYYSDTKNSKEPQALYTLDEDSHVVRIDIFLFNDYFSGC